MLLYEAKRVLPAASQEHGREDPRIPRRLRGYQVVEVILAQVVTDVMTCLIPSRRYCW
jgi:hypothetical protein